MSKETSSGQANECPGCHLTFAFMEQHWPHCPVNPANLLAKKGGAGGVLLKSLQTKFSKAELAQIASHGPMADKPIAKKRGKRPVKPGAKR